MQKVNEPTLADVKIELIALAAALDVPITPQRVKWFIASMQSLGMTPGQMVQALNHYGRTTKVRRLPLPGELTLRPPGEVVAGKIIEAISKFGYANQKEAKAFLGEAWSIVEMRGGWAGLCENLTANQHNTFIAQVRDAWDKGISNGALTKSIGAGSAGDQSAIPASGKGGPDLRGLPQLKRIPE